MNQNYRASRQVKAAFAHWPGELIYGVCVITKGRHAGRVVFYDDDEAGLCAVYFGRPVFGQATWVRRSSLRPAKAAEVKRFNAHVKEPHPLGG